MELDQYIAHLLTDHDCVIVPDFGGFVANYAPAKINQTNHRFDPPHRKVSYNKYLVHNDGLLASYVAKHREIEYEAALKDVRNYAVYLKEELNGNSKVSIEKVGVVYKQSDGTLRFEQVKNPDFFLDGFGLESFFAKAVTKSEPKPIVVQEVKPKVITPVISIAPLVAKEVELVEEQTEVSEPKEKKRTIWPSVAAAIALPIVGYAVYLSVSTPLFKSTSEFHYSDLNPFTEKVCATYKFRNSSIESADLSEPEAIVLPENEYFAIVYNDNSADKTLVVRLNEPKEESVVVEASELKFHIIGGCFGDTANAAGLAKAFSDRGSNASIVDKKGNLYRVSIASFATKKEAREMLASYQNQISGAWILYK